MTSQQLTEQILAKRSFLCVGLDVDLEKIPPHLLQEDDPIFAFNKAIIDATAELCVAYKPNTAFYEAYGLKGWQALQKTIDYLNAEYPDHFTIADAKRGDIGNTSTRYAKAFFESMNFDSVTVAPYMGRDSVEPFLQFEGKYVILLALTSNAGAFEFQTLSVGDQSLYEQVIETASTWENADRLMYVVGATKAEHLAVIRQKLPRQCWTPGELISWNNLRLVWRRLCNGCRSQSCRITAANGNCASWSLKINLDVYIILIRFPVESFP